MQRYIWADEEIEILKTNYLLVSAKKIMELLPNKNYDSIRNKLRSLAIKKAGYNEGKWTKEEDDTLLKKYPFLSNDKIKKEHLPHRTKNAIKTRARFLKVKKKLSWSEEEIQLLKKNYPITPISKLEGLLLSKTKYEIKNKARKLRLYKEYSNLWSKKEDIILKQNYPCILMNELKKLLINRTEEAIRTRAGKLKLYRSPEIINKSLSKSLKGINKGRKRPDLAAYNKNNPRFGSDNGFFGKIHSIETREKISEMLKKNSAFFHLNKNAEFQSKRMKAMGMRPTTPEKILMLIIDKYLLPFKYTGDGKKIIGTLNPDFIHNADKKICIEVFGDYWHNNKNTIENRTEEGRKKYFSEFGYETVILWEHELKSDQAEEIALNKIRDVI